MCGSMVDIQSAMAEIRRGKKKEQTTGWKYIWPALLHRVAINNAYQILHLLTIYKHTSLMTTLRGGRHLRSVIDTDVIQWFVSLRPPC